ncbi:MAG: alpha/beta hydrolase, partial [Roseovarius sp.]|nr:alpha/beta hydrolase [Roseovarius sp.]
MIKGFTDQTITLNGVDISFSRGGSGPPLLLLHGFPQTRSMWAAIAPALAESREVVCPDLPGYGLSSKPHDVKAYSFRNMAAHQIGLMRHLGHGSFDVAGHDRGGRVAHRMALDSPEAVNRLCVMDIVPTHTLLTDLRMDVAHGYYHWFFMSQPEPFPEKMIERNPDFYYESCLLGWGASKLEEFNQLQVAAYRKSWNNPDAIRGMCNDYRAAIKY